MTDQKNNLETKLNDSTTETEKYESFISQFNEKLAAQ